MSYCVTMTKFTRLTPDENFFRKVAKLALILIITTHPTPHGKVPNQTNIQLELGGSQIQENLWLIVIAGYPTSSRYKTDHGNWLTLCATKDVAPTT